MWPGLDHAFPSKNAANRAQTVLLGPRKKDTNRSLKTNSNTFRNTLIEVYRTNLIKNKTDAKTTVF